MSLISFSQFGVIVSNLGDFVKQVSKLYITQEAEDNAFFS